MIVVGTLVFLSFFLVVGLAWAGESSGHIQYVEDHWKVFLGGSAAVFVILFVVLLKGYRYILRSVAGGAVGLSGLMLTPAGKPVFSPDVSILLLLGIAYMWLAVRLLRGKEFRQETNA